MVNFSIVRRERSQRSFASTLRRFLDARFQSPFLIGTLPGISSIFISYTRDVVDETSSRHNGSHSASRSGQTHPDEFRDARCKQDKNDHCVRCRKIVRSACQKTPGYKYYDNAKNITSLGGLLQKRWGCLEITRKKMAVDLAWN